MPNRNGITPLDQAIVTVVRRDLATRPGVTIQGIAAKRDIRRATLQARFSGRIAFHTGLLAVVAEDLGTTASDIVARAEELVAAKPLSA